MAWTTLTTAEITGMLTSAEVSAIRSHMPAGLSDPMEEALDHAVREVRGYVMTKRRLAAGMTVPDELRRTTLIIARHHVLSIIPSGALMTEGRRKDYDDAIAQLRAVARGEFGIEEAEVPVQPASAPATSAVVSASTGLTRRQVVI